MGVSASNVCGPISAKHYYFCYIFIEVIFYVVDFYRDFILLIFRVWILLKKNCFVNSNVLIFSQATLQALPEHERYFKLSDFFYDFDMIIIHHYWFRWSIDDLIKSVPTLGLVVDLTFTSKYYDFEVRIRHIDIKKKKNIILSIFLKIPEFHKTRNKI